MKYGEFKNIGKAILMLRKSKNWTQAELAKRLNITDKAVSKWENGAGCPDISQLPSLAELFGVSIDFIMAGEREIVTENKPTEKNFFPDIIDNELKDLLINKSLHNHLIIIDELFNSLSPKEESNAQELKRILETGKMLFREILHEYPVHYCEYIKKLLSEKQYSKIFEFAVDFCLSDLSNAVLSSQDAKISFVAGKFIYDYNLSNTVLKETQRKNGFSIVDEENGLEVFNKFKEQRLEDWIEKIEMQIEELTSEKRLKTSFERINKEVNREFLIKQLNKDNLEMTAIKLCVKLEAFLKYCLKNDEDDLLTLIDKCAECNDDDRNLLHQLRMYRNSITHPDNRSDEHLSKEELLKCTEIIVELTEGAYNG